MTDRYAFQYEARGKQLEDGLEIYQFDTAAEAIKSAGEAFAEYAASNGPKAEVSMSVSTPTEFIGRWALDDEGKAIWVAEGAPE